MSVIVKDMEMPDTCEECRISIEVWNDMHCPLFAGDIPQDFGRKADCGFECRPDWCPLRPLPEKHGDLVDISQQVNIEYFDDMNQEWSWKAGTVADALVVCEEFPTTIVEAEE